MSRDFIVDTLQDWWQLVGPHFPLVKMLQLDMDNGPENHSHRTQFISRLIQFVQSTGLTLELAYYPPYHSKYNPIERCWAGLENHWNGTLLDTVETVVRFAQSLKWCGTHPFVKLVTRTYETGVKLTKQAMRTCEEMIDRRPSLRKWFVTVRPNTT
jgi:Rhodopirellula transposase DDE domain